MISAASQQAWVRRYAPRPDCAARLVCFHHAGAGAAAYRPWALALPADIELCAVQLPGRGERMREKPIEDPHEIVEQVVRAVGPLLDRPYAIFGHSMGALLAALTASELCSLGAPRPKHLFVSGRRPLHVADTMPRLSGLDDRAFIAALGDRYGALPAEVLAEPELLALLLPTLRADIRAIESFEPPSRPAALPVAITAMGGDVDTATPVELLDDWKSWSSVRFERRVFGGGHFYIEPRRSEVIATVSATFRSATSAEAGHG